MIKILLLSYGLAMDAFSVCVSYGVCHKDAKLTCSLRLAFFTGFFQFIMTLLGWFGGSFLGKYFIKFGPWIAFLILSGIGIKMIIDSLIKKEDCKPIDISRGKQLIIASLATSIDAFIAGFSIGFLNLNIHFLIIAGIIGIITFKLSLIGIYLGKIVGFILGKWAEVTGGFILIGLGVKILLEAVILKS